MGTLFAAGFGPDCLDRYSWDQVFLMAECIGHLYAQRIDMVARPIAQALGAEKYSSGRVEVPGRRKGAKNDQSGKGKEERAMARDARILAAASKYRIRVVDVPGSSGGSEAG